MSYKTHFPMLVKNPNLVYLDNAATTQKPEFLMTAYQDFYENSNANIHRGNHTLGSKATQLFEEAKKEISCFFDTKHILYTQGATYSLNLIPLILSTYFALRFKHKNEVVISDIEHHSNFLVWQRFCKNNNLVLKVVPTELGVFQEESFLNAINEKTGLIALTACSNVTGQYINYESILEKANKESVLSVLDICQLVPKRKLQWASRPSFWVASSHKIYGPTSLGFLGLNPDVIKLMEEPLFVGGGIVSDVSIQNAVWIDGFDRHQPGTPQIAEIIVFAKTIQKMKEKNMLFSEHEKKLHFYLLENLLRIECNVIGFPQAGIVSFLIDGVNPVDLDACLVEQNISIRTGSHCALPFMKNNALSYGTNRASIACYNEKIDVDKLIEALQKAKRILS